MREETAKARQRAEDAAVPFLTKVRRFFSPKDDNDDDDDSAGGRGGGRPELSPVLVPIPVYMEPPDGGRPGLPPL